jgi:hypothetical protein
VLTPSKLSSAPPSLPPVARWELAHAFSACSRSRQVPRLRLAHRAPCVGDTTCLLRGPHARFFGITLRFHDCSGPSGFTTAAWPEMPCLSGEMGIGSRLFRMSSAQVPRLRLAHRAPCVGDTTCLRGVNLPACTILRNHPAVSRLQWPLRFPDRRVAFLALAARCLASVARWELARAFSACSRRRSHACD